MYTIARIVQALEKHAFVVLCKCILMGAVGGYWYPSSEAVYYIDALLSMNNSFSAIGVALPPRRTGVPAYCLGRNLEARPPTTSRTSLVFYTDASWWLSGLSPPSGVRGVSLRSGLHAGFVEASSLGSGSAWLRGMRRVCSLSVSRAPHQNLPVCVNLSIRPTQQASNHCAAVYG